MEEKGFLMGSLAAVGICVLGLSCVGGVGHDESGSKTAQMPVQIWYSDNLVGTGVPVGDGSEVITVLDYVGIGDGPITVESAAVAKSGASILRFDPRTGATLLKLQGNKLRPLALSNAPVTSGQGVHCGGWYRPSSGSETLPGGGIRTLPGEPTLASYDGAVSGNSYGSPERFRMTITSNTYSLGQLTPGSPVVDIQGNVVGLMGNVGWGMVAPSVPPGYVSPVIGAKSLLELLSPEAAAPNGPVGFDVARPNSVTAFHEVPSYYEAVASALAEAMRAAGARLSIEDTAESFSKFPFAPLEGTVVAAVYASPVELLNSDGLPVAEAKWLVVQWGRKSGKPDLLFYGTTAFSAEGVFELNGDISGLKDAVQ